LKTTHYIKSLESTVKPGPAKPLPFIYLALPVMDEQELLPRLLGCLVAQNYRRFRLFACVNQPDAWWDDPAKAGACSRNAATISVLRNFREFEIDVTDRSSRGNGWKGKQHGVGYARKTVMDQINQVAGPGDIMVSLDADTVFGENYLRSVAENFAENPTAAALAVPYYHNAPSDPVAARAILRYEIYMRH
jgi:cellulose synthase/poly-beta-1,6-N-acetylglucosamine synthase-like glycosyltransferase